MAGDELGFIGGGKMAEAILAALVGSGTVPASRIVVSDVSPERLALLERDFGVTGVTDNRAVLERAAVIFLAVKPQQLDAVVAELAPAVRPAHLLISIAAGKRLAYFESRLPGARIVRVMPNLAALVAASMNVFCMGATCAAGDRDRVMGLLASFGAVLELDESRFDAVTAVSGSGPAFVAHFMQALIAGGVALGLSEVAAQTLAQQTLLGTAQLLSRGVFDPESLIRAVSSAKGTTVAGLEVLLLTTMTSDVLHTLQAAAARSRELSQ